MQSRTRSNFAEPKPLLAPELVYRCKVTKLINALQAFFQFIPNYFLFSNSLIFVKSPLSIIALTNQLSVFICVICVTPILQGKIFLCFLCDNLLQGKTILCFPWFLCDNKSICKAISELPLRPEILVFQPILALWTFLRGNSDFPLTKLPLSPNETSRYPKALSALSSSA